VTGATIGSGGMEVVQSGGTVNGVTLNGGYLDIASGGTAGSSMITFTSVGGMLKLGYSQNFAGVLSGFGGGFDSLDLADIAFGAGTTIDFIEAPSNTSGTLTVSDGTHTAQILLLGQYMAADFSAQSNGAGGTVITDPSASSLSPQSLISQPGA
jgi:autotransporter passenger strand-loop-strand repeat protein